MRAKGANPSPVGLSGYFGGVAGVAGVSGFGCAVGGSVFTSTQVQPESGTYASEYS